MGAPALCPPPRMGAPPAPCSPLPPTPAHLAAPGDPREILAPRVLPRSHPAEAVGILHPLITMGHHGTELGQTPLAPARQSFTH